MKRNPKTQSEMIKKKGHTKHYTTYMTKLTQMQKAWKSLKESQNSSKNFSHWIHVKCSYRRHLQYTHPEKNPHKMAEIIRATLREVKKKNYSRI